MLRKCAYVSVKWFIIKIDHIGSCFASVVPRDTIGKCREVGKCPVFKLLVLTGNFDGGRLSRGSTRMAVLHCGSCSSRVDISSS